MLEEEEEEEDDETFANSRGPRGFRPRPVEIQPANMRTLVLARAPKPKPKPPRRKPVDVALEHPNIDEMAVNVAEEHCKIVEAHRKIAEKDKLLRVIKDPSRESIDIKDLCPEFIDTRDLRQEFINIRALSQESIVKALSQEFIDVNDMCREFIDIKYGPSEEFLSQIMVANEQAYHDYHKVVSDIVAELQRRFAKRITECRNLEHEFCEIVFGNRIPKLTKMFSDAKIAITDLAQDVFNEFIECSQEFISRLDQQLEDEYLKPRRTAQAKIDRCLNPGTAMLNYYHEVQRKSVTVINGVGDLSVLCDELARELRRKRIPGFGFLKKKRDYLKAHQESFKKISHDFRSKLRHDLRDTKRCVSDPASIFRKFNQNKASGLGSERVVRAMILDDGASWRDWLRLERRQQSVAAAFMKEYMMKLMKSDDPTLNLPWQKLDLAAPFEIVFETTSQLREEAFCLLNTLNGRLRPMWDSLPPAEKLEHSNKVYRWVIGFGNEFNNFRSEYNLYRRIYTLRFEVEQKLHRLGELSDIQERGLFVPPKPVSQDCDRFKDWVMKMISIDHDQFCMSNLHTFGRTKRAAEKWQKIVKNYYESQDAKRLTQVPELGSVGTRRKIGRTRLSKVASSNLNRSYQRRRTGSESSLKSSSVILKDRKAKSAPTGAERVPSKADVKKVLKSRKVRRARKRQSGAERVPSEANGEKVSMGSAESMLTGSSQLQANTQSHSRQSATEKSSNSTSSKIKSARDRTLDSAAPTSEAPKTSKTSHQNNALSPKKELQSPPTPAQLAGYRDVAPKPFFPNLWLSKIQSGQVPAFDSAAPRQAPAHASEDPTTSKATQQKRVSSAKKELQPPTTPYRQLADERDSAPKPSKSNLRPSKTKSEKDPKTSKTNHQKGPQSPPTPAQLADERDSVPKPFKPKNFFFSKGVWNPSKRTYCTDSCVFRSATRDCHSQTVPEQTSNPSISVITEDIGVSSPSMGDIDLSDQATPSIIESSAKKTATPLFWSHNHHRAPNGQKLVVHYCRSLQTAEAMAQHFLNSRVIGFDMEWKPQASTWDTIQNNVSLIQIANEERIALFQVALFKPARNLQDLVSPTLKRILESPDITKVGVAIKADSTRLRKYLGIETRSIFELSHLFKLVKHGLVDPKLVNKRAVNLSEQIEEHFGLPLEKSEDVRCGDWARSLNYRQVQCEFPVLLLAGCAFSSVFDRCCH